MRDGVVFVVDMRGVRLGRVPRSHLRSVLTLLSKRLPLRVQAEIVVDPPLAFRALLLARAAALRSAAVGEERGAHLRRQHAPCGLSYLPATLPSETRPRCAVAPQVSIAL